MSFPLDLVFQDLSTSPSNIQIQARIDAFLRDIFDIYKLSPETTAITILGDNAAAKVAICDAVEVAIRRLRNGRTLFSRLVSDVVHSIFESALDLDQIHDPNIPLDSLDRYRHQLFRMRRVSTAWNNFLLSSPQYWRAIDIKSPLAVISAGLERSGSATLCIYCIKGRSQPVMPINMVPEELRSSVTRVQTLRSDDPYAYLLCRWLIRTRTPALRILNLVGRVLADSVEDRPEPLGDLSPIRHLTAATWQPPPDASWLAGLKELILAHLYGINTDTLQVLSACTSLERLSIQSDDAIVADEFPGAPPSVTLPFVQTMDLKFSLEEPAVNLTRRLVTPRCLRGSLDIKNVTVAVQILDQFAEDYCNFISLGEVGTQYPNSVRICMEGRSRRTTHLVYETESRRVAFELLNREVDGLDFNDLVHKFQTRLEGPPLTVTIVDPSEIGNIFLKPLSNENVRAIRAHFERTKVDYFLRMIESRYSTQDWRFESLKYLAIHEADLNVSHITRLVGIRWKYLQKNSKTWLEEIDLVNCRLRGMRLGKAVKQLAAIGVTIRGIGCTRM